MVCFSKKVKAFINTGSIENAFMKVWICSQKLRRVKTLIYKLKIKGELWAGSRQDNVRHSFKDESSVKPKQIETYHQIKMKSCT